MRLTVLFLMLSFIPSYFAAALPDDDDGTERLADALQNEIPKEEPQIIDERPETVPKKHIELGSPVDVKPGLKHTSPWLWSTAPGNY